MKGIRKDFSSEFVWLISKMHTVHTYSNILSAEHMVWHSSLNAEFILFQSSFGREG